MVYVTSRKKGPRWCFTRYGGTLIAIWTFVERLMVHISKRILTDLKIGIFLNVLILNFCSYVFLYLRNISSYTWYLFRWLRIIIRVYFFLSLCELIYFPRWVFSFCFMSPSLLVNFIFLTSLMHFHHRFIWWQEIGICHLNFPKFLDVSITFWSQIMLFTSFLSACHKILIVS